jgi:hypothetical protein
MTTMNAREIAKGLCALEREWLTGWQGSGGAAFNAIGEGMAERGLTRSSTDWTLSALGRAVAAECAILQEQNNER